MKALLSDKGVMFFDVNNRLNAPAYGWLRVLERIAIEAFHLDDRRGDVQFDWKIANKILPAKGHLFTPLEMQQLISESGLKIKKRVAVNYETGQLSRLVWLGQLVYLVTN